MTKIMWYITSLLIVTLATGCHNTPTRPANVPANATAIAIPHGYDWDYCWVDKNLNVNECRIYNRGGELLYGGVFLRYEGSGVVPEEALKITQYGGEQFIKLQNGVILIPASHYVAIKNNLDWINGKRDHP
jgi:hypothetical protein